jgi:hypothetical protein
MRLVLNITCSLMMCGAVSASTDVMDGMVSAFERLKMGGLGSAFKPFEKQNAKPKVVVRTASASVVPETKDPILVVPAAVALANDKQALSAESVSVGHVSTSGSANSVADYFRNSGDPFSVLGASKLTNSNVQNETVQAPFQIKEGFSMGVTEKNKPGTKSKSQKSGATGKKDKKFSRL